MYYKAGRTMLFYKTVLATGKYDRYESVATRALIARMFSFFIINSQASSSS
uniref:Uncharacterized protein n=1 Tax=Anguilla anguilla TaxID=7936 RepID=A0A0E9S7U3_ANGAN